MAGLAGARLLIFKDNGDSLDVPQVVVLYDSPLHIVHHGRDCRFPPLAPVRCCLLGGEGLFFIYSSFVTLRIAGSNVLIFCSFPDQIRQLVLHFHPGSHLEGMRQGHLTGSLSPVRHWLHTLPGCSLPDRMYRYLHCMPDLRLVRMRSRALLQVPLWILIT